MSRRLSVVIERLCAEFWPFLDPDTVAEVVRQCRRDLVRAPRRAGAERVERLARKRLGKASALNLTGAAEPGPGGPSSARMVAHR